MSVDPKWLDAQFKALVEFAANSAVDSGFGYLGRDGIVDRNRPVELWITCRMTHVMCLGYLRGMEECRPLAEHGLRSLLGPFYDSEYGGWFSAIGHGSRAAEEAIAGTYGEPRKEAYAHAFVLLAATSLAAARIDGAEQLVRLATECQNERWWDEDAGKVRESFDRTFTISEDYRGINANMHTVEAYLAAADVLGDETWRERATRIVDFAFGQAKQGGWRIAEHFSADWRMLADYNRDDPAHPFRPYGVTPGHGFEWARLGAQLAVSRGDRPDLIDAARELFSVAAREGWNRDGKLGFVYTTDYDGRPIVTARMHWVACEALAAANVLGRIAASDDEATADYESLQDRWWSYVREVVIASPGRWNHEVDGDGVPQTKTWPGMPDVYHAAQCVLMPRIPVVPVFAAAVAEGHGRL
ncbi:MAG: AGE family epimerase/isomerase [Actinomycetaceae bacterium]|nr:AGE family epimerase/isomerase [Actinomycetaceae bacterium]